MRTILSSRGQIIDNRKLIMSISYYSLPLEKVHELVDEFYCYINHLFSDFVLDWKFQNRSFKDLNDALRNRSMKNGCFSLFMRGNLICEEVYNKTTFRRFEREKMYPQFPQPRRGTLESADYAPYRHERSSLTWDSAREKEAALEILNLEGKCYFAQSVAPDVLAYGENVPMELGNSLFYGSFFLEIPLYCLESEINSTAERLLKFCLELEDSFKNVNAYVECNPRKGCYSKYFGLFVEAGPAAELPYRNIARSFYFPEFGWGNVISSKTRSFGIRPAGDNGSGRISTLETHSGGLCIRGRKPILDTSIADLKNIKEEMYDVIMPRYSILKGICDLRKEWEAIPTFEDELTVYPVGYIFRHHGEIDFERFSSLISAKPRSLF